MGIKPYAKISGSLVAMLAWGQCAFSGGALANSERTETVHPPLPSIIWPHAPTPKKSRTTSLPTAGNPAAAEEVMGHVFYSNADSGVRRDKLTYRPDEASTLNGPRPDDRELAILVLNRILDHESNKLKFPDSITDARVDYVMQSIFVTAGKKTHHLKTYTLPAKTVWVMDTPANALSPAPSTCHAVSVTNAQGEIKLSQQLEEDPSDYSYEEMYAWLQNWAQDALKQGYGFRIETDWVNTDTGTHFDNQSGIGWPRSYQHGWDVGLQNPPGPYLRSPDVVPKQEIFLDSACNPLVEDKPFSLELREIPATWSQFREVIRQQLKEMYDQYRRKKVWQELLKEIKNVDEGPLSVLKWKAMFSITPEMFAQMYAALKNTPDLQALEHLESSFLEVNAQGILAADFSERFVTLLTEQYQKLENEINRQGLAPNAKTKSTREWLKEVLAQRHEAQAEVYRKAVREFAAEILKGELKISSAERSLAYGPEDVALLRARSAALTPEEKAAFDDDFYANGMNAYRLAPADDGTIKIMTPLKRELQTLPRPFTDPAVQLYLKARIESRIEGQTSRQLAYELFNLNPFEFSADFCRDVAGACPRARNPKAMAQRLAEALFPETLFPGQFYPANLLEADAHGNLVNNGPGAPIIQSTLNHDEFFDRVQEIDLGNLPRVFTAVNPEVP